MAIQLEKEKSGELIQGKFGLMNSPVDVQLTVHINNMFHTWGKNQTIQAIKHEYGMTQTDLSFGQANALKRFDDINSYYGEKIVRQWFTLIYGWKFKRRSKAS